MDPIAGYRLRQQGITPTTFDTPEQVVRWMGAMQAQDYHQVLWAIGVRLRQPSIVQVEQAIAEGRILRTYPARGTIHVVLPEEARWRVLLNGARTMARDKRRLEQLELDEAALERSQVLFVRALEGGRRLTRSSLLRVLDDDGLSTAGARGYHLLWHAAHRALICMGPMDGKEQTYVLLDEWAPGAADLPRDEAPARLARGYFTSHGPATVADLAWWAGITLTEARAGLEAVRAALHRETINGVEFWRDPAAEQGPGGTVLLPGFDEYLLGYTRREDVLPPDHAMRVVPGGNGVFFSMVVLDGQVVGTWKRTLKKDRVQISRDLFGAAPDPAAFTAAAERYAAFHGLTLEER